MLVVIGYEHNDLNDINHHLLFGSSRVYPENMSPGEYVAAGVADGAVGILAHPDEIRNTLKQFPPYPWNDWSVNGYTGLEIWNQMSEWMERLTPYNKLPMALSPRKSMIGPTDRVLAKWDELSKKQKVVGVAGVDAHAFKHRVGPFTVTIFPYKVHFRCLRTHIILTEPMSDNFETAKTQLYDAIRECRVFFSNLRWGAADKFLFIGQNSSQTVTCGGTLTSLDKACLRIELPAKATIRIIGNGQKVFEQTTDKVEYELTQPGIYRVEAWKGKRGWIFSNHIRVEA
jgi:hypothetical protein